MSSPEGVLTDVGSSVSLRRAIRGQFRLTMAFRFGGLGNVMCGVVLFAS